METVPGARVAGNDESLGVAEACERIPFSVCKEEAVKPGIPVRRLFAWNEGFGQGFSVAVLCAALGRKPEKRVAVWSEETSIRPP